MQLDGSHRRSVLAGLTPPLTGGVARHSVAREAVSRGLPARARPSRLAFAWGGAYPTGDGLGTSSRSTSRTPIRSTTPAPGLGDLPRHARPRARARQADPRPAPLDEVQEICGSAALACYDPGSETIVASPDDQLDAAPRAGDRHARVRPPRRATTGSTTPWRPRTTARSAGRPTRTSARAPPTVSSSPGNEGVATPRTRARRSPRATACSTSRSRRDRRSAGRSSTGRSIPTRRRCAARAGRVDAVDRPDAGHVTGSFGNGAVRTFGLSRRRSTARCRACCTRRRRRSSACRCRTARRSSSAARVRALRVLRPAHADPEGRARLGQRRLHGRHLQALISLPAMGIAHWDDVEQHHARQARWTPRWQRLGAAAGTKGVGVNRVRVAPGSCRRRRTRTAPLRRSTTARRLGPRVAGRAGARGSSGRLRHPPRRRDGAHVRCGARRARLPRLRHAPSDGVRLAAALRRDPDRLAVGRGPHRRSLGDRGRAAAARLRRAGAAPAEHRQRRRGRARELGDADDDRAARDA